MAQGRNRSRSAKPGQKRSIESKTDSSARVEIRHLSELHVRAKKIPYKQEGSKQNPNSIRFLIGHIMNMKFDGEIIESAKYFQKFVRYKSNWKPKRADGSINVDNAKVVARKKKINQSNLSKILDDEADIAYWHVEPIAKSIGLPCGAFLAFSRLYSLVAADKQDAALAFATGLQRFSEILAEIAKSRSFGEDELNRMALCFTETYKLEGEDLFSPKPPTMPDAIEDASAE